MEFNQALWHVGLLLTIASGNAWHRGRPFGKCPADLLTKFASNCMLCLDEVWINGPF